MSTEVVAVSTVSAEQQQSPSAPAQQNSVAKVNLLGMSRPQLEKFFEDMGEKKFRAGQVMKWIHQFFVTDFAEMTNISGKLREKLEKLCEIKAPEVVHKNYSKDGTPERERSVTNVVMMGMGEPLLNYDAVLSSMRIMLDDFAYGMSKRRVTLSTSGVVPKIDQLAQDIDVALAISLHAPNDELRNELVPINKKYPLAQLIAACQRYIAKDGNESARKHVTIEYVMLDGVNDHPEHAQQMIKLLKNLPSKINLIPFNPFPHAPYGRSSRNRIISFQKTLSDAGFVCTIRQTRGDDIDAACGQLVGQVADRTRRSEQWKKKVAEKNEILRSQG
ncbi:hypothetical protein LTR94_020572 [Friedmanniomyces endolithicus]|nr:hypothetical protein LTR94_020572 [Friedmanniomyces endolithicus]